MVLAVLPQMMHPPAGAPARAPAKAPHWIVSHPVYLPSCQYVCDSYCKDVLKNERHPDPSRAKSLCCAMETKSPRDIDVHQDRYHAAVNATAKGIGPVPACGSFDVSSPSFPKCIITVGASLLV